MKKEVYDFLTSIGVYIKNYPPKLNITEPSFIKASLGVAFTYYTIDFTFPKNASLQTVINEMLEASYKIGLEVGERKGIESNQNQIKEALGL